MQKLVTIFLTARSEGAKHGDVEEHLGRYLDDGWSIVTIHGFGGSSSNGSPAGWVVAVLEKGERPAA